MNIEAAKSIARHQALNKYLMAKALEHARANQKIVLKNVEARRHDEKALQQHRVEVTRASISIEALEAYAKWQQEKEIEVAKAQQVLNTSV